MKRIDYTVPYEEWTVTCNKCGKSGQVKEFPSKWCTRCGNTIFIHSNGFQKKLK